MGDAILRFKYMTNMLNKLRQLVSATRRNAIQAEQDEMSTLCTECPGRDSNPHWKDFKSSASADWATGAVKPSGDSSVLARYRRVPR